MKRNSTIDVLKGICIIWVLITHCAWEPYERLRFGFPFWIDMAVPIFLVISGYVNTVSFRERNLDSIALCYNPVIITRKFIRYTVPFVIAYALENVFCMFFRYRPMPSAIALLREFLSGGIGPGSYYYPILIQMILLLPAIYMIVRQNGTRGLAFCAGINLAFELMQWAYGMPEGTYRLLIFRYFLLLAFGCYFGLGYRLNTIALVILSGIAVSYTVLTSYYNYTVFFMPYWKTTSFIPALLAVCVFSLVHTGVFRNKVLETVGKASYHIFLTQMVYYVFAYIVYKWVPVRWMQVIVNVGVCLTFGLLFYILESPISGCLMEKFEDWASRYSVKHSSDQRQ